MTGHPTEAVLQDWTAWREARGISLQQIAETTKISVRYLEAIERGAFERLPGGIYTEGYIRQYARAIGDTGNALWDYYRLSIAKDEPAAQALETPPGRTGGLRSWLRRVWGVCCDRFHRLLKLISLRGLEFTGERNPARIEPRPKATGE